MLNNRAGDDVAYTHNIANEYTKIDSATQNVFHDDAGNLTDDPNNYHYYYDHENRLTKITKGDSTEVVVLRGKKMKKKTLKVTFE